MKHRVFAAFASSIFIVFALAGCFGAPDPQTAVSEGFHKALDQKKASMELSVAAEGLSGIADPETKDGVLEVTLAGKTDNEKPEEAKFDGTVGFTLKDPSTSLASEIAMRVIGKELFLKLNSLSLPEDAAVPPDAVSVLTGKWWSMPTASDTASYFQNLTEEQKQIVDELKKVNIFVASGEGAEEDVKGVPSWKYKVTLDSAGLQDALVKIAQLSGNQLPQDEVDAISEGLKSVSFDGYVWVAKKGGIADRVQGTISFAQDDAMTITLDYLVWDFGKSFEVETPADATPFNPSLLLGLMGLTSGSVGLPDASSGSSAPLDTPLGSEQVQN